MSCDYAELYCLSNFSFLRGASQPEELVQRASELGYRALAITDECSVAGVVRAYTAAKNFGLKLIVGSEFVTTDGLRLVLLATNRNGYGNLCQLITKARLAAAKGEYCLESSALESDVSDCLALWIPADQADESELKWLKNRFKGRLWIAVRHLLSGSEQSFTKVLRQLGAYHRVPLVAVGEVHMHRRSRRALQDTLTAIRLNKPLRDAGLALFPNGERHLRPFARLERLYPADMLRETLSIANRCCFDLSELRYEYPRELVPTGYSPAEYLRAITEEGMRQRWPQSIPKKVRQLVEHELALINELAYEPYFLTVHDIVRFARSRGILCQGRGSAANSAVCYCLGITEVDPARMEVLFERFISRERDEPPDIDVDFEHERREEVIQYIYTKYGRHRTALAATVITYRARSALRDLGKVLGLSAEQVDRLARSISWWDGCNVLPERLRESGFDPDNPVIRRLLVLFQQILGFPRHFSQHVGGFVIAADSLDRLVPIENAAMPERTIIQWDKDDLEALGLLKIDVLALGMLSAIRKTLDLISGYSGQPMSLADIPAEDSATYKMIGHADTLGVFQIESRAQMSMLPRLRPRCFYDLVVQVAIIRPGPIQGDMVHPYLRRRQGIEPVSYPSKALRKVLERTLGVPLFQEQVIQLAMVAAGFSAGEADRLRRTMAAWRRYGSVEQFELQLVEGMVSRGYNESFAKQIFRQIQGFSEYGFPESHAASFALLAYASAWLKCHHPAAFTCALINSQPMGFYAPAQLVQDAQRYGVEVRPVDVLCSQWDCTLEGDGKALRLGLRLVKGLSRRAGERLESLSGRRSKELNADSLARLGLNRKELQCLADAGALERLAGHRRSALWQVLGVEPDWKLGETEFNEQDACLRQLGEAGEVLADYSHLGLSLRRHPMALLRDRLDQEGVYCARQVKNLRGRRWVTSLGMVIGRQRPGTAKGTVFITLEDETGFVNVIVWPDLVASERRCVIGAKFLQVEGQVQREGEVVYLLARRLRDRSDLWSALQIQSRDFH